MKRFNIILLIAISIFLIGCEKKIDTTSDESSKDSIQKAKASLSAEKQKEFEDALKIIAYSKFNFKDNLSMKDDIKLALNGKTAEQVIVQAEAIKAEKEAKQKVQALEEIKELEIKQSNSIKSAEELKKIEVYRSIFSQIPQKYGDPKPLIELTLQNGLKQAISRIYFVGTVESKGRTIAWIKEDFNYEISGGLEPNETAVWNLAPNQFSKWGRTQVPSDAIFTVDVIKVDGADGKTLYSIKELNDKDLERLNELKKKYGVQ